MIRLKRSFHKTVRRSNTQQGFTIAELIIVIAIFTIITAVALFNQGALNSNVLLTNMTYETALAVQEAQLYGIAVHSDTSDTTDTFSGRFGAHYDVSSLASSRQVIVFAADPSKGDGYVSGAGEEKYEYEFTNQRGNYIKALCVGDHDVNNIPTACNSSSPDAFQSVDVIFTRPQPEPSFWATNSLINSGSNPNNNSPILQKGDVRVYIVVSTQDNSNCKVIVVEQTGQVHIEDQASGYCSSS